MAEYQEYNPLDYENLTKNIVQELMNRGPYVLPLAQNFPGAGVYALFYVGDFPPYAPIRSTNACHPIYVGKAVPAGGRKGLSSGGRTVGRPLYGRITEHFGSIQAAQNIRTEDFLCRFLIVTPLWITMAERFLIEHYRPIWNVCVEGFGLHDPGRGRHEGEVSWWDALHPGRPWAARLRHTKTADTVRQRLQTFLESRQQADRMTAQAIKEIEQESPEFADDS